MSGSLSFSQKRMGTHQLKAILIEKKGNTLLSAKMVSMILSRRIFSLSSSSVTQMRKRSGAECGFKTHLHPTRTERSRARLPRSPTHKEPPFWAAQRCVTASLPISPVCLCNHSQFIGKHGNGFKLVISTVSSHHRFCYY